MQINVLDMRDAGKLSATNGAFRLSGGGYRLGERGWKRPLFGGAVLLFADEVCRGKGQGPDFQD